MMTTSNRRTNAAILLAITAVAFAFTIDMPAFGEASIPGIRYGAAALAWFILAGCFTATRQDYSRKRAAAVLPAPAAGIFLMGNALVWTSSHSAAAPAALQIFMLLITGTIMMAQMGQAIEAGRTEGAAAWRAANDRLPSTGPTEGITTQAFRQGETVQIEEIAGRTYVMPTPPTEPTE